MAADRYLVFHFTSFFLSLVLGYLSEEQQQEMCNAPNRIELNWEFGKCIVLDNKQSLRRSSFVDFAVWRFPVIAELSVECRTIQFQSFICQTYLPSTQFTIPQINPILIASSNIQFHCSANRYRISINIIRVQCCFYGINNWFFSYQPFIVGCAS